MNRTLGLIALGCVSFLAACGGGGGSPGLPSAAPTQKPTQAPIVYSSKLVFVGQLGGTIQSDLRRVQSLSPMTTGSPIPIMVVSPISAQGNIGSNQSTNWGGNVEVVVSPMPSSSPSTTFTQTNPDAVLGTPDPNPTAGVVAQAPVAGSANVNAQASGTATATVGDPVNQSPSTSVYAYQAISLECKTPLDQGSAPAYSWNGNAWVAMNTITGADIYLTGSQCTVPGFSSSESSMTIHFPASGTVLSTDNPFNALVSSQWAATQADLSLYTAATLNPDGSTNSVILAKTAGGSVFKLFPLSYGYNDGYNGAIEVSGNSVDGF